MVLNKTLLLKGLAGVAALGGVGGVGGVVIKNKLDERAAEEKKKEDEQNKQKELEDKKKEVNEKLKTLGIEGCELDNNNISDTTTFSKDCELDQDKFKKIKFSNKDGDKEVNVEGWTNGNTVKLTISNKDDGGIKFLFKEVKDDLTISKSSDDQTDKFSIKANKETEFEEKPDNKLSKKVNGEVSSKLKGYNAKFKTLSLPETCRFDETEEDSSIKCEISDSELKQIKFSNKGDSELSLSGLNDSEKIKLTIERDSSSGTESLKYKFKNETSSNITLTGESNQSAITLRAGTEREFEESDSKLKKKANSSVSSQLVIVNDKLKTLKLPDGCRFDDTEEDTSIECDISEAEFKKIKFSNKADDDTDLTVAGWNNQGNIKLKVERVSGDGNETLKYLFKDIKNNLTITGNGSKSQDKITLKKGADKEFKEEDGKLSKVFDKTLSTKLKEFNNNLGDLSVPDGCRFDDTESDEKLECNISEQQIKKIKFWNKGEQNQDLTISQGTGFTGLKLILNKNGESLKYTFKDANRKIVVSGGDNKSFNLKAYTDAEFEFKDGVLQRPRKIEGIAKLVGLTCTYTEGSKGNTGTCTLGDRSYINVSSNGTTTASLQFYESNGLKDKKEKVKFNFSEYEYDYENNVKFTYIGEAINSNDEKLEVNSDYEVKKVGLVDSLSKKILE